VGRGLGEAQDARQLAERDGLGHRAEGVQRGGGTLDGLDGSGHTPQARSRVQRCGPDAFDIVVPVFVMVERSGWPAAPRSTSL
jgi:hypothetical protein